MRVENQGKRLEGKVAIVTGGASGIGEAVAKIYAANACKVLIVDLNEERLRQVEADIKGGHGVCAARCADVTDEGQVISFFHDSVERWGKLDILVNSAGRDSLAPPISQVTLEEWNRPLARTSPECSSAVGKRSGSWKNSRAAGGSSTWDPPPRGWLQDRGIALPGPPSTA